MIDWNEIFTHDTESPTGLRWKYDRAGNNNRIAARAGSVAGYAHADCRRGYTGYGAVRFGGKAYLAHRIIWEMYHGPIPDEMEVDHENGNTADMDVGNMRLVSHKVNTRNKKRYATNTTGVTGVYWYEAKQTAQARWVDLMGIRHSKNFRLGTKESLLESAKSYRGEQLRLLNQAGAGYTERHINGN